ncbi:hypothetical protein [Bradyrhizobium neotropicale]|uniref:hypothetical protein n=1 Tax=Bradyrhizobium neotropicale TaxID=1497615 RepID=UPI001AD7B618|nr:hypothetical protein [Bradyrhizobium neotropicale]MBO4221972.1 hypothetical protein [Bradyrhizobium neotropicale]
MKRIIAVGLVAIAALNSAWIVEGTDNNCAALERVALRKSAEKEGKPVNGLAAGFMVLSNGRMAAAMVTKELPSVPTPLACVAGYWIGRNQ